MKRVKTIDAEVAGEPLRLVVDGAPTVPGRTMADKLAFLRKHGEALRTLLMLEPRGHAGMHGAMLTEPASARAHVGLLSMHAAGFPLVSGEAIIAAVTIALDHKLIEGVEGELLVDTSVGVFRASHRPASVSVSGVPSFVHTAGMPLRIGSRHITVDIAFGGQFYAIADSEAIGIPIDMANAAALIRMGRDIKEAVESIVHVQHPADSKVKDVHGTIFTASPRGTADLRSATVLDGEVLRRSPGVTGTAAVMAVLNAMGLLPHGHPLTHEGILGTTLSGSIEGQQQLGDVPAVVPVIEGSASITGFHEFVSN